MLTDEAYEGHDDVRVRPWGDSWCMDERMWDSSVPTYLRTAGLCIVHKAVASHCWEEGVAGGVRRAGPWQCEETYLGVGLYEHAQEFLKQHELRDFRLAQAMV